MEVTLVAPRFRLSALVPSITAGLVTGIVLVNLEISFASLIFAGPLAGHLAAGIGFTLFGAVVICALVALTSSYPGTIALPISNPVPILALIAAGMARAAQGGPAGDAAFYAAAGAMCLTSIITGLFLVGLGRFRLGALIRFVPYPVVGGFVAGTGWLLLQGGMGTMAGIPFVPANFGRYLQPEMVLRWLPGLAIGVTLVVVLPRFKHFLVLPGLIVGAIIAFDLVIWLTHTTPAQMAARGWSLGALPAGGLWQPLAPTEFIGFNWNAFFGQWSSLATVCLISILALLLNMSRLELAVRRDIDLNRELQSAGAANVLAGLGGGTVGYQSLSLSVLGYRMGTQSRLIGLVASAFCALILFFGAPLLPYIPKPVPAGLNIYLGLAFLVEWIVDARSQLPRAEYGLVLIILAVMAVVGFVEGVAVGLACAVVLFVVSYSRTNMVRFNVSAVDFRSTVDRRGVEQEFLREHGRGIQIVQLHNFIFFGTAHELMEQLRRRMKTQGAPALHFLVLDFRLVTGFDSSAVSSLLKLRQVAESNRLRLVLTGLPVGLRQQIERQGLHPTETINFFPTLDDGLEWCEEALLADGGAAGNRHQDTLPEQLREMFAEPGHSHRFVTYLERQDVEPGTVLIHQGEPADCFYFIGCGEVSVEYSPHAGKSVRLRKQRGGTTIGEMGVYQRTPRSASVIASQPSTLYRLSAEALKEMEQHDPEVAGELHKWVARIMAERASSDLALRSVMLG